MNEDMRKQEELLLTLQKNMRDREMNVEEERKEQWRMVSNGKKKYALQW